MKKQLTSAGAPPKIIEPIIKDCALKYSTHRVLRAPKGLKSAQNEAPLRAYAWPITKEELNSWPITREEPSENRYDDWLIALFTHL